MVAILLAVTEATSCTRQSSRPSDGVARHGSSVPTLAIAATVVPLAPHFPQFTGIIIAERPALSVATIDGTTALKSCAGRTGLVPMPTVQVGGGEEVTISGVPSSSTLTEAPGDLVDTVGSTFVAVHAGSTTVTIHGFPDRLPVTGTNGPQSSCAVVILYAT